jgi:hypothetical protein
MAMKQTLTAEARRHGGSRGENGLSCSSPCFLRVLRASAVNRLPHHPPEPRPCL